MSYACGNEKCPQCGYEGAYWEHNNRTREYWACCWRCGYEILEGKILPGIGALKVENGFICIHENFAKYEKQLREHLAAGDYLEGDYWLTRWNGASGQVETVIGIFGGLDEAAAVGR